MANQELATTEQKSGFLVLADFQVGDTLREELVGLDISFERIKIPSGGSTMFEVPGDESGETESVKEFSAVILHHQPLQVYYATTYTGGNMPPDCCSYDTVTGIGNPGGTCANCPYNRFGSGVNKGKACKSRHLLYLLREGELFPMVLSLPTCSLKEFSSYLYRLIKKGRKLQGVLTRFSLTKATSASKMVYSLAHFAVERTLTAEEVALLMPLSEQVKEYSTQIRQDIEADPEGIESIDPETGEITRPL